jgi:protein-arginine deiminase
VSFIPADKDKGFDKGFAMLLASPGRAMELLEMETGLLPPYYHQFGIKTGKELLEKPFGTFGVGSYNFLNYQSPVKFNKKVHYFLHGPDRINPKAPKEESVKDFFKRHLKLSDKDIVELPVFFANSGPIGKWAALALTPGVVNLSCMDRYCMIPDPFIPGFKKDVEDSFARMGEKVLWIDNWQHVHLNHGEVHCASNMLREPFAEKWWAYSPPDAKYQETMPVP